MKGFATVLVLLLSGCSLMPSRIKVGDSVVTPPKDNGTAATLSTFNAGQALKLAAGSRLVMTKFHSVAGIPETKDQPAVAPQPEKEVTEIYPSADTEWHKTEATVAANSGTVDTSIRTHEIDVAASKPLLYAAILSAALGVFFIYRAYPTPAIGCFIAAVVFFAAFKVSGLPSWFWGLGLVGIAGGAALYFGHERGLATPKPPVT